MRAPATRGLQSQAALVAAQCIESCEQSPSSGRRALHGACFWVSKTSISGFVAVGPHCAQLKTCCRIGGWNHHSGHRAIIFCDNCTQRSAIVFLTPGQLVGQMYAPRIHFKEHMHTEKTRLQHQIWPQKRGQFSDLQFVPFPIEGWFWGPLVGLRNGPRNSAFFLLLLPYHLGLNIWPAWPQLQRFSACQTGFTTKGSTCSKCPCTIIIICDQHSYYDCKHTHTVHKICTWSFWMVLVTDARKRYPQHPSKSWWTTGAM